MDLRDALNQYYYDTTVCDLRQLSRTGGGELSYNSIMYQDVISFQEADGGCTVGRLAKTLRISAPAATLKVNELVKMGLVEKSRSETDRRVVYLRVTNQVAESLKSYDSPFERAAQAVERRFTADEIRAFCSILGTFTEEYKKDF